MIYRGSLNSSGSTWSSNLIIAGVSEGTVGSDTLFNDGSGLDLFVSDATFDDCIFTGNTYATGIFIAGGAISAENGTNSRPCTRAADDFADVAAFLVGLDGVDGVQVGEGRGFDDVG